MASSIACRCIRMTMMTSMTTGTELHKMASRFQVIGYQRLTALVYIETVHPCYGQLTPVKTKYLLTSIIRSYHRLKLTAQQAKATLFFEVSHLPSAGFSIWTHVRLTCSKQGRVIWKQVDNNPNIKW